MLKTLSPKLRHDLSARFKENRRKKTGHRETEIDSSLGFFGVIRASISDFLSSVTLIC